jgi:hypothetical protein
MRMSLKEAIAFLAIVAGLGAADAQGISNARDGGGNLVDRGAATRTYPSGPMANSANVSTPSQVYVAASHRGTVVIRRRR